MVRTDSRTEQCSVGMHQNKVAYLESDTRVPRLDACFGWNLVAQSMCVHMASAFPFFAVHPSCITPNAHHDHHDETPSVCRAWTWNWGTILVSSFCPLLPLYPSLFLPSASSRVLIHFAFQLLLSFLPPLPHCNSDHHLSKRCRTLRPVRGRGSITTIEPSML